MKLTRDEATERVNRGAELLDLKRPGWHKQIDIGRLAMETCSSCIVGQLRGFERLPEPMKSFDAYYGFDLFEDELEIADAERISAFRPLQDAWIEAIADRRLSQAPATAPSIAAVDPVEGQPISVATRVKAF